MEGGVDQGLWLQGRVGGGWPSSKDRLGLGSTRGAGGPRASVEVSGEQTCRGFGSGG